MAEKTTPKTIVNSQSTPVEPVKAKKAKSTAAYVLEMTVGEKTIKLDFGKSSKTAKAAKEQLNNQSIVSRLTLTKVID